MHDKFLNTQEIVVLFCVMLKGEIMFYPYKFYEFKEFYIKQPVLFKYL
jgi:hypothetical protein